MLTFKSFRLEVYRRHKQNAMVTIQARDPAVDGKFLPCDCNKRRDGNLCDCFTDIRPGRFGIDICADYCASRKTDVHTDYCASKRQAGINFLSFYMAETEFNGLFTGKLGACNDIGHNLRASGEHWTFFDLEFPRETRGVAQVPYVVVNFPHYVQKILHRAVRLALCQCDRDPEPERENRVVIEIPWSVRERWMRRYGNSKGQVQIDVSPSASEFLRECATKAADLNDTTFVRCMEHLDAIARNTTYKSDEVGVVKLSKDMDGFYFEIYTPKGRRTLNGGVINHGRDGKVDWSLHT